MPSNLGKKIQMNAGPTLSVRGSTQTSPFVKIQSGDKFYNMLESQLVSPRHIALHHSQDVDIIVPPQRAVAVDDIESGRSIEFIYESGSDFIKIHERPKVRFDVTNSDTGNQSALPVQMWADVELYFDKQTTPAFEYKALACYQDFCNRVTSDNIAPKGTMANMSTTYGGYGSAGNLSASGTDTYYLDIQGPWDCEALPNVCFQEMKVKVKLLGTAKVLITTGNDDGVYQLTNCNMYIPHLKMSDEEADDFKARFVSGGGLTIQCLGDVYDQQSKALANSTSYSLDLGVEGQCAELILCFRTSLNGASSGAISPTALISTVDLCDSKNQSLTANNPFDGEYLLRVSAPENYGNALCHNKAFYTIPFVKGGQHAVQQAHGARIGGWYINENDRIKLTTNTSAGGSTYYLDVIARVFHTITFRQGKPPIVHRS